MANISKSTVQNAFNLFCKVYKLRTHSDTTKNESEKELFYKDSFLQLDYYQGYRIVRINTDTSESHPFGSGRKTGREMFEYIQGLLAAMMEDNFKDVTL